jgi:hypothetical protein
MSLCFPLKRRQKIQKKVMSGEIKWQSRVATEAAQIKKPISIQQGEELISGEDGSATIYYQNGLRLFLSPGSHVSFVQMLSTNFVFNQLKGEVEYQKRSSVPLAIRSLHLLIQMDDSNGDIQMTIDEKTAEVDLIIRRGSVRIAFNDEKNLSNVINLREGDHYQFDDKKRQGSLEKSN